MYRKGLMAKNACGYSFEKEIATSGRFYGMHIRKIPITQYASVKLEGVYDFYAIWNGIPVAIECKATRTESSFPFNRVEKHQLDALQEMVNSGGRAYILINIRRGRKQTAYYLSVEEFTRLRNHYSKQGRKSIPLGDMVKLPTLERCQNPTRWDIRVLFNTETSQEIEGI